MRYQEVIDELHQLANPEKVQFKKEKFGIITSDALGIYHADLKILAKKIGSDNDLALQLFDSDIFEGRLLCSKIFKPADVTEALMEKWLVTFENWEICDSFSMGLFSKSPFAVKKIREWSTREQEFEKRAAFATLPSYCMADKKSENELFLSFLPIIERESDDERLYVKKAVNWALRSIGKRNIDLNKAAINLSKELLKKENKAAKWIAKDALRELEKEGVNILDYPRAIYRT
ncbi:DNA alkylation repair protein [uncultured Arcticibacterium sp.]|uniref:DNA alkylation repair protein n=1 Tax=uncultured Arcticibacterium sp. TaxID=2173042 RepID=UPI0030FC3C2A